MKEIDSLNRHYRSFHSVQDYNLNCVDSFYYSFDLYDQTLPDISVGEFERILGSISCFYPSPIKLYAASFSETPDRFSLTNYHDASPCFFWGDDSFRVNIEENALLVPSEEKNSVFSFIRCKTIESKLVQKETMHVFEFILNNYINQAAEAFPTIWGWLKYVVNSNEKKVVTDQTLAPNQCCILHLLKKYGFDISVLQHQKNVLLSDIYPLIYMDFQLADTYYTWYSKDEILYNYGSKYYLPFDKIKQSSTIIFPMITENRMVEVLESGRRCLLVVNVPSTKYIDGTMLDASIYDKYINELIAILTKLDFEVFIRQDPRGSIQINENLVKVDKHATLKTAFEHYDICVCDRPGGASIEAIEAKGFVLLRSNIFSNTLTKTYCDCLEMQKKIANRMSSRIKRLFDSFDLICFNSNL